MVSIPCDGSVRVLDRTFSECSAAERIAYCISDKYDFGKNKHINTNKITQTRTIAWRAGIELQIFGKVRAKICHVVGLEEMC